MNARPKTFRAVVDFSVGSASFSAGDEVTGVALRAALRFGDRFVTSKNTRKPADKADETNGDD